jgi:hypothetical protein
LLHGCPSDNKLKTGRHCAKSVGPCRTTHKDLVDTWHSTQMVVIVRVISRRPTSTTDHQHDRMATHHTVTHQPPTAPPGRPEVLRQHACGDGSCLLNKRRSGRVGLGVVPTCHRQLEPSAMPVVVGAYSGTTPAQRERAVSAQDYRRFSRNRSAPPAPQYSKVDQCSQVQVRTHMFRTDRIHSRMHNR